jgi:hypothetical protein
MVRLQSKQTSQGLDEDGEEKTTISRRWGAWPLPPSRVPRPNEHMHEWFNDPDTIRMPPDPRPSAELEESIIAVMTRIAKENFLDRDWDYDEVRTNRSRRSKGDLDAMTDEEDQKGAGTFSDPSFLQPALQTDDDVSRRQLRPLARNIITQIDSLLTSLQRSGNHRFTDREASDDSGPGTDDEQPGERASQNGSRGRKRARGRPRQNPKPSGRSRSHLSTAAETEDESTRDASQSRDRSRNSRASGNGDDDDDNDDDEDGIPFNPKLPLRDWSEVMGLASMLGLPRDAVMRASKRCADLFAQDMTFRTFHEGRMKPTMRKGSKFRYEQSVYGYHESESEVDESDSPPNHKRKKTIPRATSGSVRDRSTSREAQSSVPAGRSVNVHTTVPGFAPSRGTSLERSSPERGSSRPPKGKGKGKGEHRKADLVCPIRTCSRHTDGFSRTWNLNLHMKRVHPGYQERERSRSRSRSERPEVIEID